MNKKLIALLTLVMFVVSFTGMAFAVTKNVALTTKTVSDGDYVQLGKIKITEDDANAGGIETGETVIFTLPGNVEFAKEIRDAINDEDADTATVFGSSDTIDDYVEAKLFDNASNNIDVELETLNTNSFTVKVTSVGTAAGTDGTMTVDFGETFPVDGDQVGMFDVSGFDGDVKVEIESLDGGVTAGSVRIGKVIDGDTEGTALSTKSLEVDKTDQLLGTLRIAETAPGSIDKNEEIIIKLPADIHFNDVDASNIKLMGGFSGFTAAKVDTTFKTERDGYDALVFTLNNESATTRGLIEIAGWTVDVDDDATLGDVEVSLDGELTDEDIVLGTVAEYGITLKADTAKTIFAGEADEKVATFYIQEGAKGSILPDRSIRLVLPEGFAWVPGTGKISVDEGDVVITDNETTVNKGEGESYRELEFKLDGFSSDAATLKLKDYKISVAPDAPVGDLEVTVEGRAGVEGTIKVAEIKAPIVAEVEVTDVVIGKQEQKVNDIVITEGEAGAFDANENIIIAVPEGFKFSATPKAEVVEGDMRIDDVKKHNNSNGASTIEIIIDKASKKASTIKVTGIMVDIDRTVAEGNYDFDFYGTAINEVYDDYTGTSQTADQKNMLADDALDVTATTESIEVVGIKVVTPAPEEAGAVKEVKMTVGSTVYTTDGVEMTMDAAPYLKNGRTYFPVRYVAQAVGIANENVVWDPSERTVTIFKAERIVQVKIGSAQMLVNGIPVTMDAAPEVTNGRTMLPIRFVAQALGLVVDWDAATQTVTLN